MHAISYDGIHDEFYVPQPFAQSILTFAGGSSGETAPIRVIEGSRTQLSNPDQLAVDPVNNEIFVPERTKVLVFPRSANGNVAPIRVLEGPDTMLGAFALAVDPVHNLLIAAGWQGQRENGTKLLIFNRTDEGNSKPLRVISGPKTGITGTFGLRSYPPGGLILVTMPGPDYSGSHDGSFVGVWSDGLNSGLRNRSSLSVTRSASLRDCMTFISVWMVAVSAGRPERTDSKSTTLDWRGLIST